MAAFLTKNLLYCFSDKKYALDCFSDNGAAGTIT